RRVGEVPEGRVLHGLLSRRRIAQGSTSTRTSHGAATARGCVVAVAPVGRGDVIEPASSVIARRAYDRVDIALALVLALATLLAHPLSAVARRPFWVDEAWVAVLTRLPWSRFISFSSSTPVGWVALIRLIPGTALQRSRFAVLGFSM